MVCCLAHRMALAFRSVSSSVGTEREFNQEHACGRQRIPISGYRVCLLRRVRWSIQFAVALLDPSSAEMALHGDADMVRPIVGARQIKLLSGPTGSQCQDALA